MTIWFLDAGGDSVRQPNTNADWSFPSSNQGETLSLDSALPLPRQALVSTDGLSLQSQDRTQCSAVNCQHPAAPASLKCQHCRRSYCPSCAPLSLACRKNPSGHHFASKLFRNRGPKISTKVVTRKPKREEAGPPWACKQCTMVNGPQVLVCLGCDTLRETDVQEGRNVCPMCTLVNEPGKIKCELCDTELVSQEEANSAAES